MVACIHVVEFQKRGLPHAHILLILAAEDKPRTAEDIDAIVLAEIPNPQLHPDAYATVTSCMVHGPCGSDSPNATCMENGFCSKGYPRTFSDETIMNENGYPAYRRRNNGDIIERRGNRRAPIDNRWIVPHNLWLCTKYNAHINVKICSSILAVKYLFKYVYKGHDRTRMALRQQEGAEIVNEIQEFVDARYVSATECCWRLFNSRLHNQTPKTIRLAVHLEERQSVYFRDSDTLQDVLQRNHDCTLMAWFKLNRVDPEARSMKYIEVPLYYVWQKRQRVWKRRRNQTNIIPRLYFVHPRDLERYCLRLLLLHITGATGYEEVRTVHGVQHHTFRCAAVAHGLLNTDDEWIRCLEEAGNMATAVHLFVTILLLCNPESPGQLWSALAVHLSEDYLYRSRQNNPDSEDSSLMEAAQYSALHRIGALLVERGSALQNFVDLPTVAADFIPVDLGIGESQLDVEHLREEALRNARLLNAEQRFEPSMLLLQQVNQMRSDPVCFLLMVQVGQENRSYSTQ